MREAPSQMISCTNNGGQKQNKNKKADKETRTRRKNYKKYIIGTQQYNETLEPSRPQNFPLVFLGKSIGRRRCTSQQHTSRWLLSNLHHLLQKTQMWWYGNIRENPILVLFNDKHMGWQCDIWYCDIWYWRQRAIFRGLAAHKRAQVPLLENSKRFNFAFPLTANSFTRQHMARFD